MFKWLATFNVLILLSVSNVYAQSSIYAKNDDESKGFYRIGIGIVDFEHSSWVSNQEPYYKHPHYHEAGITANFAIGYGTDKLRALIFFDPSIVDGVQGLSVLSIGAKGEVGVPLLKWLKLGGGIMYSHNHTKLSDDAEIYERADLDTVWSPFLSVAFLPRAEGSARFFADVRIGQANGGDVIQPQTGKPVADNYVSVSLGAHIKLR